MKPMPLLQALTIGFLFLAPMAARADIPPGFQLKWGTFGTSDGQFNAPCDLAIDPAKNVFVTDSNNNRIQKFDRNGLFLTKWGVEGAANGEFTCPKGIAVDNAGNVYVADSGNGRIQKFTNTGGFLLAWGTPGSGLGQFNHPEDVAVLGSVVYVSDYANDRVQRFTTTGAFLSSIPVGTRVGSLAFDFLGNVLVGENWRSSLEKFTAAGASLGTFGMPTSYGLATDAGGDIFVTDYPANRVLKLNSLGVQTVTWGTPGTGDGQFSRPFGVAVNTASEIYVVDQGNNRVQKFAELPVPVERITWSQLKGESSP